MLDCRSCTGIVLLSVCFSSSVEAQSTGTLRGRVTFASTQTPAHHATVSLVPLGRVTESDDEGNYSFTQVPAGSYDVQARIKTFSDVAQRVQVSGGAATVDLQLRPQPLRQEITVTASGREQNTAEAFQSVTSVQGYEVQLRANAPSLGDLLEREPGISKRSFGPGTTRPVIRGFDGDRVLVLQDGTRTGTLSSQSGDHGEPVDPLGLERVEVIRGPAILLYGSNAIGGVVNIVTDVERLARQDQDGLHATIGAQAGSANGMGGGSGNFHFTRNNWVLFGGGGGLRTGDYNTPTGLIPNSGSSNNNIRLGGSRVAERGYLSLDYQVQDGEYGVPFAGVFEGEEDARIGIGWRRHNTRLTGAVRSLNSYLEAFDFYGNYSDWNHREVEDETVGTRFFNKQFSYQGTFRQRRRGLLSGSFGFWGLRRDFDTQGEEALAPPVDQTAFALYGVEELNFERVRFQFGARVERNKYSVTPGERTDARDRSFTGVSASGGVSVPLAANTYLVGNYTYSYRAPALEELYNLGPHPGNVTFEIGNTNLRSERANGFEAAIRSQKARLRAEATAFYYRMRNFVYLAPTGEREDGLPVADYLQGNARYLGVEARLDIGLVSWAWLKLGFDVVDAQERITRVPLPRIPPVRGRAGLELRYKGLSLVPEVILANRQWQVFPTETPTSGYVVGSLTGTYSFATRHTIHTLGASVFNVTDQLYWNHLSFIKQYAPEIGRGVRVSYTITLF